MNTSVFKYSVLFSGLVIITAAGGLIAQTPETTTKKVNFGYSQNPKTKPKKENRSETQTDQQNSTQTIEANLEQSGQTNETIAKRTLEVVRNASKSALAPTETYHVGVGDILFINLQNSSKGSTYFTVLNDGTIDYPLAGEMVAVAGLTTDEIEDALREKVKLYDDPQISVKVREYSSHKITVIGLVEKSGEKFIQREAVPLFVVRAEAVVQTKANRVVIRRADSTTETFSLTEEKAENTLIFPNDIIEFTDDSTASKSGQLKFFFIGGEVVSVGQKDFFEGLTLTQAILVSGGLRKDGNKKIIIRRKNAEGLLVSTEYNLKLIKDGKVPDPTLEAGDTIEVGN